MFEKLGTELNDRFCIAIGRIGLGENELGKGNYDKAKEYFTEALAEMEKLGSTWYIAEINFYLAKLERRRGNEEIAQEYYQKSHQIFKQLGAMKYLERIEREWNNIST